MLKSLFATVALAASFAVPALANDNPTTPRTISLSGHGEVRSAPDLAIINLGVFTHAETGKAAVDGNSLAMTALFAALKEAGIADKDVQTTQFAVNPRYDYGNGSEPPKANGFDASNAVTVTVRQIATIGAVLDKAVTAGSNQINGISFGLAKPDLIVDEARKLAVGDAARKAKLYEDAAGVSLGRILSISEGGYSMPQPVFAAPQVMKERSADVPIAQGEQVISADVVITWELK